jgi:hypothetical protein
VAERTRRRVDALIRRRHRPLSVTEADGGAGGGSGRERRRREGSFSAQSHSPFFFSLSLSSLTAHEIGLLLCLFPILSSHLLSLSLSHPLFLSFWPGLCTRKSVRGEDQKAKKKEEEDDDEQKKKAVTARNTPRAQEIVKEAKKQYLLFYAPLILGKIYHKFFIFYVIFPFPQEFLSFGLYIRFAFFAIGRRRRKKRRRPR